MYIQGIDVSEVVASTGVPAFKVGQRGVDSDAKEYVYVHANGVAVIGDVMVIDEAYEADQVTTTNSAPGTGAGLPLGVAVLALADNEFGWVQIYGVVAAINVATSAAAHTILNTTATVGRVDDDSTAGAEDIVGLTTTAAEASNLAAGILNYPIIGITG
jgi:hypothetical protein